MYRCLLLDGPLEFYLKMERGSVEPWAYVEVWDGDVADEIMEIARKMKELGLISDLPSPYRKWALYAAGRFSLGHKRKAICAYYFIVSDKVAKRTGASRALEALGYKKTYINAHQRMQYRWIRRI